MASALSDRNNPLCFEVGLTVTWLKQFPSHSHLHFHWDLQRNHSHLWQKAKRVYHAKCNPEWWRGPWVRQALNWGPQFHRLLHWQAPIQLKCPLSSKRGAREELISQRASGTITLMKCRISPRTLQSRSADFYNYSVTFKRVNNLLTSSSSQSLWSLILIYSLCCHHLPPPPVFLVVQQHFLSCALCILHISVLCRLLSVLHALGSVLKCLPRSLAGCLDLFGEHLEAQSLLCQMRLRICCNKWS